MAKVGAERAATHCPSGSEASYGLAPVSAQVVPWLHVDLACPTAGRQGSGAELGAPTSIPDPAVMEFLNKGRTCSLQIQVAVCVLSSWTLQEGTLPLPEALTVG